MNLGRNIALDALNARTLCQTLKVIGVYEPTRDRADKRSAFDAALKPAGAQRGAARFLRVLNFDKDRKAIRIIPHYLADLGV